MKNKRVSMNERDEIALDLLRRLASLFQRCALGRKANVWSGYPTIDPVEGPILCFEIPLGRGGRSRASCSP